MNSKLETRNPKLKKHGSITVGQCNKIWAIRSEFNIPTDSLYNIVEDSAKMRCPRCSAGQPCNMEHRSISSLSKEAAGDVIMWIEKTIFPSPGGATSEERFIIRGLGLRLARAAPEKFGDICRQDYAGLKRIILKNWKVTWRNMSDREGKRITNGMRAMIRFYESKGQNVE